MAHRSASGRAVPAKDHAPKGSMTSAQRRVGHRPDTIGNSVFVPLKPQFCGSGAWSEPRHAQELPARKVASATKGSVARAAAKVVNFIA